MQPPDPAQPQQKPRQQVLAVASRPWMRERTNNPRTEHNAAAAAAATSTATATATATAVASSVSMEPKQHRAPTLTPARGWSWS